MGCGSCGYGVTILSLLGIKLWGWGKQNLKIFFTRIHYRGWCLALGTKNKCQGVYYTNILKANVKILTSLQCSAVESARAVKDGNLDGGGALGPG